MALDIARRATVVPQADWRPAAVHAGAIALRGAGEPVPAAFERRAAAAGEDAGGEVPAARLLRTWRRAERRRPRENRRAGGQCRPTAGGVRGEAGGVAPLRPAAAAPRLAAGAGRPATDGHRLPGSPAGVGPAGRGPRPDLHVQRRAGFAGGFGGTIAKELTKVRESGAHRCAKTEKTLRSVSLSPGWTPY